ncbi:MAG: L-ornithine N5-monooxygenase [Alphaproteobacteria bacterium]|jgi:L-ornithine N5-oxygenase|nr:L-ornithine N5-monooxygenase [Alphaproteobacteria bacterium]
MELSVRRSNTPLPRSARTEGYNDRNEYREREPKLREIDVLGIGFGPSNLALAVAFDELGVSERCHFIEQAPDCNWQSGMLLDGSDIQNNPIRDLVTPRDPQSYYTFINYLKQNERLFEYLNLGLAYPLRKEYARYIRWVASHFKHLVTYSSRVTSVELLPRGIDGGFCWCVTTVDNVRYIARCLVVGTGRTPNIPKIFRSHLGPRIFHLNDYLPNTRRFLPESARSIAVIGASQSAVEIVLDLMARFPSVEIQAIHRSFGFRQKDTSPFSDQVYFPDFTEYFYNAPAEAKQNLNQQLRATNYSSADIDVIHRLYVQIYEERLDGNRRVHMRSNMQIVAVEPVDGEYRLTLREQNTGAICTVFADTVVLATGFLDLGAGGASERYPALLGAISSHLDVDAQGVLRVNRDYSVEVDAGIDPPALYLNGLCESSHGLGDAGSFSMLALRSMDIARSALERSLVRGARADPRDQHAFLIQSEDRC